MATPRAFSKTKASGSSIIAGQMASDWSLSLLNDTWNEIPNTTFTTKISALISTAGMIGSDLVGAVLDSYSDPAFDKVGRKIYFFGGGHSDSTNNGVYCLDIATMTFSVFVPPTPSNKYPPIYAARKDGNPSSNEPGELTYPVSGGPKMNFLDNLTDPLESQYSTPVAPKTSHRYAAHDIRGRKIHYFYGYYCVLDLDTGTWGSFEDLGPKLAAYNSNFQSAPLQQGTMAVYDDVRDQFWVLQSAGDAGLSWRSGFIRLNPTNTTFVANSWKNPNDRAIFGNAFFKGERGLYIMGGNTTTNALRASDFVRHDMDADTSAHYRVTQGDTFSFSAGTAPNQNETIPSNWHPVRRKIWRYSPTHPNSIFEVDVLNILGGTGTVSDPYQVSQRRLDFAGSFPATKLNYRRMFFDEGSNAMLFLPRASTNVFAVRATI